MKLIVIEGIDGSGKSTLARNMFSTLSKGHKVTLTQEPFTDDIKQLLEKYKWNDQVLLALLFSADRQIHVRWMQAQDTEIIICDRYYFSTLAYQGVSVDWNWLETLSSIFPKPDLTILLDIPAYIALERLKKKRESLDFKEKRESLEKVRQNYLTLASKYNFKVLDASLPEEKLQSISLQYVYDLLSSSTSRASLSTL
ncbi:MAG: dTMP kinase [Metallosphaera sp.]